MFLFLSLCICVLLTSNSFWVSLSNFFCQAIQERQRNPALGVRQIPLVLCGDLNSLPDSSVYQYLSTGELSPDHPDVSGRKYEGYLSRLTENNKQDGSKKISHSFKLSHAFGGNFAMPFTNFTYDFTGIIDYIFHTTGFLHVRQALGQPDPKWLKDNKIVGFPHPHFPSDHIPLGVDFELCMKSNLSVSSSAVRPPSRNRTG